MIKRVSVIKKGNESAKKKNGRKEIRICTFKVAIGTQLALMIDASTNTERKRREEYLEIF